ncbi:MAG: patatin-like phospholipase family protein [Firmicutes bacterium]|nr:patatin-like phospholipase family protein [Bacillota bacterium]MDD4708197.1 patatin-like phospholipase family protein [Bacillota bacterium]
MALGLALSGGGIRGASHIGALRALEEAGLKPDMIAGSSAGSIIASLYATGMTVDGMEAAFLKYAPYVLDIDFAGALGALLRLYPLFRGKPVLDGIIKGNNAEKIVNRLTEGKRMSQADIPLAITATDINDGTPVVFASRRLAGRSGGNIICCSDTLISEAVRASIAIPVVFKPKAIKVRGRARRLVDGGVTNNLPVDVLRIMGAERIIGINLGYSGQRQEQVDNILEIGSQTIDIMMFHITKLRNSRENVVELMHNKRSVVYPLSMNRETVVVNPQIYDVSLFEMKKIPQCIERGYAAVKSRLPEIKKVLEL